MSDDIIEGTADIMNDVDRIESEKDALIQRMHAQRAAHVACINKLDDALVRLGVPSAATVAPVVTKQSKPRGSRDNSAASKVQAYVTSDACTSTFNAEHVAAQLGIKSTTVGTTLKRLSDAGTIVLVKRGEYRKVTQ